MDTDRMRVRFLELLWEENKVKNLVSRRLSREELELHWEDALAGVDLLRGAESCVDVGSGGGFPALPLAMALPETMFTLVEAEGKKVEWLRSASRAMGLENTVVMPGRVEEMGRLPEFRGQFEVATARAVAELRVLLEYTVPLVKVGGMVLCWKGPALEEEIKAAAGALQVLKAELYRVESYELGGEERHIALIRKHGETPGGYPRRVGIPKKRPL